MAAQLHLGNILFVKVLLRTGQIETRLCTMCRHCPEFDKDAKCIAS